MKAWLIAGALLLGLWLAVRPSPRPTGITQVALPRGLAVCLASKFATQKENLPYQLKLWFAAIMEGEGFTVECGERIWRVVVSD